MGDEGGAEKAGAAAKEAVKEEKVNEAGKEAVKEEKVNEAAKEAVKEEKVKPVPDQPKETDEKKAASEPPAASAAKEKEQQGADSGAQQDQSPAVLSKVTDLKEKPRTVVFKVSPERRPVWSEIKIQNPTSEQKTFKVKCTSADLFRVQPTFGLLKPNDTSRIRVWFQNSSGVPTDGKKHYFAVYFMSSQQGKTIKEMWGKNAKHEGICRINVQFEKQGEPEGKQKAADGSDEAKK